MLVLAFMFSRMRQITIVMAISDMQAMGTAKNQSWVKNLPNSVMGGIPREIGCGTGPSRGQKGYGGGTAPLYLCTTAAGRLPGKSWTLLSDGKQTACRGPTYFLVAATGRADMLKGTWRAGGQPPPAGGGAMTMDVKLTVAQGQTK